MANPSLQSLLQCSYLYPTLSDMEIGEYCRLTSPDSIKAYLHRMLRPPLGLDEAAGLCLFIQQSCMNDARFMAIVGECSDS